MVLSSETKRATTPMYKDAISSPGKICLAPTDMKPLTDPMMIHGKSMMTVLAEKCSSALL